jgi:hypothetical protein
MRPQIQAADEIIFNVGRQGIGPGTLTQQELLMILADPSLLQRTTFVFGATF